MARPSSYKPEYAKIATAMCQLGATDIEVADAIGIDRATLYRWKSSNAEFCDALKVGKEVADNRVERSLYAKATGYSYDTVKVFCHQGLVIEAPFREHVPPDTTAMIFWLKNRKPAEWRDKTEHELSGKITHEQAIKQLMGLPDE